MALTPSAMRELGTPLPRFSLPDTRTGELFTSEDTGDAVLVVAFICNHCPFVVHLKPALAEFGKSCQERGAQMVAVSANDVLSHPADSPENMKLDAEQFGYSFPYLYDDTQEVARAFDATCTPDFFVFDREGRLAYRGQFDDSRPGNGKPITGADLRGAVEALLRGEQPSSEQKASIGCNIKWKS